MERFKFHETSPENKEKESKKAAWGSLRTLALAASLLANGGFIADQVHQKMHLQSLERGGTQAFSVDFGGDSEDDLDPLGKWGEHAEFSLRKEPDGRWLLVGSISAMSKPGSGSTDYSLRHTVTYELPSSLTSAAAEALLNDLRASARKDSKNIGAFEETLNQAVSLSTAGTVVYYNPATGRPKERFEFRTADEQVIQTNYFNDEVEKNGDPMVLSKYQISLKSFQDDHESPVQNYEHPEQRERQWRK